MEKGGYAWWYLDALSDDGAHALTLIAFVGSVFSPYYAHARRARAAHRADPENHCAINVALYGRPGRWTMTERGRSALRRSPYELGIGPSRLSQSGDTLCIEIDEIAVPLPRRVRGTIRVHAPCRHSTAYPLDAAGLHLWQPIAPVARIEVSFETPRITWSGQAYLDSNRGTQPLEQGFRRWDWSRVHRPDGGGWITYDLDFRDGSHRCIGLEVQARGERIEPFDLDRTYALVRTGLPASRWGIERVTRCDAGATPKVMQTLTDAPFYARSLVKTVLAGHSCHSVHESLDLDRFDSRWVQAMLPFRMPRRGG